MFEGDQIILQLLAKNVAKISQDLRINGTDDHGFQMKRVTRDHATFNEIITEVAAMNEKEIMTKSGVTTDVGKCSEIDSDLLCKALVYNHLLKVSRTLAMEFSIALRFQLSSVKLEKTIEVYSRSSVHGCEVREQKVDVDEGCVAESKVKKVGTTLTGKNKTRNNARKSAKIEVNECPETRGNLTLSLVYNHLKEVSPKLAAEFSASH